MERNNLNPVEEGASRVRITRRVRMGFWKGCGVIAIALIAAKLFAPSLQYGDLNTVGGWFAFAGLVFVIWLLNTFLKPLLIVFTLPFILLTLGAGVILMDALVIWMASGIVPGIRINSFWNALLAGFLVELFSWIVTIVEANKVFKKKSGGGGGDYIDV